MPREVFTRSEIQPEIGTRTITTRKRSLGQGNMFTPVCHSVHGGGWSGPGGGVPGPGGTPGGDPPTGRLLLRESYWNVFLFVIFLLISVHYQAEWVIGPFALKFCSLIQNNNGPNFGDALNFVTCEHSFSLAKPATSLLRRLLNEREDSLNSRKWIELLTRGHPWGWELYTTSSVTTSHRLQRAVFSASESLTVMLKALLQRAPGHNEHISLHQNYWQ